MNKNTDRQMLRQMAEEIISPIFESVVDMYCDMVCIIYDNLNSVPEAERNKVIKMVIENHSQALLNGFKAGIPPDFEDKLKEAVNGGQL